MVDSVLGVESRVNFLSFRCRCHRSSVYVRRLHRGYDGERWSEQQVLCYYTQFGLTFQRWNVFWLLCRLCVSVRELCRYRRYRSSVVRKVRLIFVTKIQLILYFPMDLLNSPLHHDSDVQVNRLLYIWHLSYIFFY